MFYFRSLQQIASFFIAEVFEEFEVLFLTENKKYEIYPQCTCGCLHKLISDEPEMGWKVAENRGEEDKLEFDLSGRQECVKENWLEVGLGKYKR